MSDSDQTCKPLLRQPHLLSLLAGAVVLARWIFLLVVGATFEDSLISLRYAENLAGGHGLVYNPGERVFGATTPLYLLFLAGLVKVGLPALAVAKVTAAAADGVTFWLWGRELLRRTGSVPAVLFFFLLFGLAAPMVQVSVSGMETSFALLLLSLAILWDMQDRPLPCGAALGLLALVRPDGAIAGAVLLGMRWLRTRQMPWAPALLAFLIILPWLAAATWFYGTPIPNSIPAKAAAYNIHRPSILPNLADTLAFFVPFRGPWGRLLIALVMLPVLLLAARQAVRELWLRPLGLLFLAWWAYLVLPKTLLFTWYMPPLLLLAYAFAAFGLGSLREGSGFGVQGSGCESSSSSSPPSSSSSSAVPGAEPGQAFAFWVAGARLTPVRLALGMVTVGVIGWMTLIGPMAVRLQAAEEGVRREIGLWLRENTPEDARIAMEPIGYIGYYSRRRILDEVGLVSPEMVPINRAGAGWFPRMIREFSPEYIVERPGHLLRNQTLNSKVPIFRTDGERREFLAEYEAVHVFATPHVPKGIIHDYRFVLYARRTPAAAREWRRRLSRMDPRRQEELLYRALVGPVELRPLTAAESGPPRPR